MPSAATEGPGQAAHTEVAEATLDRMGSDLVVYQQQSAAKVMRMTTRLDNAVLASCKAWLSYGKVPNLGAAIALLEELLRRLASLRVRDLDSVAEGVQRMLSGANAADLSDRGGSARQRYVWGTCRGCWVVHVVCLCCVSRYFLPSLRLVSLCCLAPYRHPMCRAVPLFNSRLVGELAQWAV